MRIAIATDAWFPQINGVVRTLAATVAELDRRGYEVELITPENFTTMPMPGYAAIRLALAPRFTTRRMLGKFKPDIVHIATEGPIGWSARGWCKSHGVPFTSAFHTQFPKYAAVRTGLSEDLFWPVMRRFHSSSRAVLAATPRRTSSRSSSIASLCARVPPGVTSQLQWAWVFASRTLIFPSARRHDCEVPPFMRTRWAISSSSRSDAVMVSN